MDADISSRESCANPALETMWLVPLLSGLRLGAWEGEVSQGGAWMGARSRAGACCGAVLVPGTFGTRHRCRRCWSS